MEDQNAKENCYAIVFNTFMDTIKIQLFGRLRSVKPPKEPNHAVIANSCVKSINYLKPLGGILDLHTRYILR